jgi:hypothetical protein
MNSVIASEKLASAKTPQSFVPPQCELQTRKQNQNLQ